MRRLPAIAFVLLAAATVAAFFVIDAIKVGNPLVFGNPGPIPAAFNPVSGRVCLSKKGVPLDYRKTTLTFSVGYSGTVGVYVVAAGNLGGDAVATVSSGVQMGGGATHVRTFTWNGRLSDGRLAPDGTYYFRIVFENQGRSANLTDAPIEVITHPPHPRVLSVRLAGATGTAGVTTTNQSSQTALTASVAPVISPPHGAVRIHFTAGAGATGTPRRIWLDIYRTDVAGKAPLIARLPVKPNRTEYTWDGQINGVPVRAGTYLVGITAQDAACDQVSYPISIIGVAAGAVPNGESADLSTSMRAALAGAAQPDTAHTGLTVRYLSVVPPLTPTDAGSRARVEVESPLYGFTWKLRDARGRRVIAHGRGPVGVTSLAVRLPERLAGMYLLSVKAGSHLVSVPLVASATGRAASRARVLVVLPMLSWVGQSAVDDTGDGLPSTLVAGDPVPLRRPLVDWSQRTFGDDAALLTYLNEHHRSYQLTTDIALAVGRGPSLVDRWGVLLPDGSYYLPGQLGPMLAAFVRGGARVLVLGTGVLAGTSQITGYPSDPAASAPVLRRTDIFGVQHGPLTSTDGALIVELADQLNLLDTLPAITGFSSYQPTEPPAGVPVSAAGVADGSVAVAAFTDGKGIVMEFGLPDFGATLAANVDSQDLLDSAWPLLAKQG
ncbi:MAG: hypothetical protein ACP5H2_02170 [Solirubrobacteraceae bacterium]